MNQVEVFGKEVIANRFHLPKERVEILIQQCGMPYKDEKAFSIWFAIEENSKRFLEELKQFGAIAQMEATWAKTSQTGHHHGVSAPDAYGS